MTLSALCEPCEPRRRPEGQHEHLRQSTTPRTSTLRLQPALMRKRRNQCAGAVSGRSCAAGRVATRSVALLGASVHGALLEPGKEATLLARNEFCSCAALDPCSARQAWVVCTICTVSACVVTCEHR
uniref:Uncharacterized protein n=1 Tax=Haptolina ericina TaxID=156174 RepID=A0A7S3AUY7_9EUKA